MEHQLNAHRALAVLHAQQRPISPRNTQPRSTTLSALQGSCSQRGRLIKGGLGGTCRRQEQAVLHQAATSQLFGNGHLQGHESQ